MHYAIVKCERVQVKWEHRKRKKDNFWKKHCYEYLDKLLNDNKYNIYTWDSLKNAEENWDKYSNDRELYNGWIKNGQCTLWEGEVNQERLRIKDNLYIPSLEIYLEIKKVEVNPNGEIFYYVEYDKEFYDTVEKSRLKAIEEWIKNSYSEIEKFEDLNSYKETKTQSRIDYEEYLKYKESILNKKNEVFIDEIIVEDKYVKKEDVVQSKEDLQWETVALIGVLGLFGLMTLMIIIGILN